MSWQVGWRTGDPEMQACGRLAARLGKWDGDRKSWNAELIIMRASKNHLIASTVWGMMAGSNTKCILHVLD